jgi:hypothetical protein
VLPDDRPSGPFRRALRYFGLVSSSDERFQQPSSPAPTRPAAEPEASSEPEARSEPSEAAVALRKAAVYFGLADPPARSRYGEVERELDDDIDALRARIAELERRLDERRD